MNHSSELLSACRKVVTAKDEMDIKMGGCESPSTIAEVVAPFYFEESNTKESLIDIDPALVIGAPWRKYAEPEEAAAHEIMDMLDANTERELNAAKYGRVGTLPLYFAKEGKNRASLYRAHQRNVKAFVKQYYYPPPEMLQLEQNPLGGAWWLSTTDRLAISRWGGDRVPLLLPDLSVPLLRAYGVNTGSVLKLSWPHKKRKAELWSEPLRA